MRLYRMRKSFIGPCSLVEVGEEERALQADADELNALLASDIDVREKLRAIIARAEQHGYSSVMMSVRHAKEILQWLDAANS
jgi:hypothetical protein